MCPKKGIVIALHGVSCTGKSTIAKELAKLLNCQLRSAGELVRSRSKELDTLPVNLPLSEHRKIDEATRLFVRSTETCLVVEGSFLDLVLDGMTGVRRIRLTCGEDERHRRFFRRHGHDDLDQRDEEDRKLKYNLHGDHVSCGGMTFDTTSQTPLEVAQRIKEWLVAEAAQERD